MAHKSEFVSTKNGYYVKADGPLSLTKTQVITNAGTVVGNTDADAVTGDTVTVEDLLILENSSLSGAGAVPLTHPVCHVTTTGADALTLADGTTNQTLTIVMVADGGDGTLTPANLAGGTTITFDDVGDTATLYFDGTNWNVIGQNGVTIA